MGNNKYKKQLIISYVQKDSYFAKSMVGAINKGLKNGIETDLICMEDYTYLKKAPSTEDIDKIPPGFGLYYKDSKSKNYIVLEKDKLGNMIPETTYTTNSDRINAMNKQRQDIINRHDSNSRVYIIGHGTQATCHLEDSSGRLIDNKTIIKLFSSNPRFISSSAHSLYISVLRCYGGVGLPFVTDSPIYTEMLNKDFAKNSIPTIMAGRTGFINMTGKTSNFTKAVDSLRHGAESKILFETDPITLSTLKRPVIYKDNIVSIISTLQALEYYKRIIDRANSCLTQNPRDTNTSNTFIEGKSRIATILFDLSIDNGYNKNMGEDFLELNSMKWGKESKLSYVEIYNIAKKMLLGYAKKSVEKDPTLEASKLASINKLLEGLELFKKNPTVINLIYKHIAQFSTSISREIDSLSKYYDRESSNKLDNMAMELLKKDEKKVGVTDRIFLLQKVKLMTAITCIQNNISNPEIEKLITVNLHKDLTLTTPDLKKQLKGLDLKSQLKGHEKITRFISFKGIKSAPASGSRDLT